MKLVNDHLAVEARLVPPRGSGYLLLAAEAGAWCGPLPLPRRARRVLLDALADAADQLAAREGVEEAAVFRAVLRPPGEGTRLLRRRGVSPARYDAVLLVRTADPGTAAALRGDPVCREVLRASAAGRRTCGIAAHNVARIGDVDHRSDRLFLFNYFHADDTGTLLRVWRYTAGWFQARTGLPDSVLMQPLDGEPAEHGIVNHASWPGLRAFLPALVLRPSFRRFVLANFRANGVAAQPVIHRLHHRA